MAQSSGPKPSPVRLGWRWIVIAILLLALAFIVRCLTGEERTHVESQGKDIVWIGTKTGEIKHRHSFEAEINIFKAIPWKGVDYLAIGLKSNGTDGGQFCMIDKKTRRIVYSDSPDIGMINTFYQDISLSQGLFEVISIEFCEFDGSGEEEIVVMRRHAAQSPSYIQIIDRDFKTIGSYYHRGHINIMHITDLDEDGCDEIYAGGAHNPSLGASAFILDREHCAGFAQDGYHSFRFNLADSSLARLILPGFDQKYLDLLDESRLEIIDIRPSRKEAGVGQLVLRINKLGNGSLFVATDENLNPISVYAADPFKLRVRQWLGEGLIDRDISSQEYLEAWLAGCIHFTKGQQDHP
jgi:hypothetical protein